jgi:hypothetical protein
LEEGRHLRRSEKSWPCLDSNWVSADEQTIEQQEKSEKGSQTLWERVQLVMLSYEFCPEEIGESL